ncbi:unnamed protein product [Rangifer tarandus platyrhynchus]|uniref:Uncharacterized protein n=2 Tax=Rangifer tarandus platyrhynchus TaxID=3082113 RepID=A0ABN8XVT1_RANTA|nr:unnamed protein product [Rangifer tarandus platyrhynchus]
MVTLCSWWMWKGHSWERGYPLKGGYGLLISVFIIKDKLKLGAWSLVTMDVSVVPQAHMASYSLAPPRLELNFGLSLVSELELRLGRELPKFPQQDIIRIAQLAAAHFSGLSSDAASPRKPC